MCKAIELRDVSYCYPNSIAPSLKNITFSVEKGNFVVIMGTNGAGKTTLNLCLNGLIPQLFEGTFTGNVIVENRDLACNSVYSMAQHIGLVLDDPEPQILGRTVQEDTAFGPVNLGLPVEDIYRRVATALNMVGLAGYEERDTSELSGGEKQRLVIAGVLALEPEVLALDEPTSELDPAGRAEIYETIDNLRGKRNLTILLTEHNSEEIIDRADEVIVLNRGAIAWKGNPEELFRNIPLLNKLGIRPIPVSIVGWALYQKGRISFNDIPLNVASAEKILRKILLNHPLKKLINESQRQVSPTKPEAPALLQVTNLNFQYTSNQTILHSINLAIHKGEFVAIIGPNGSGKTTLTKHFNGLLKPLVGEVLVDGRSTRKYSTSHLATTVGYVFQNPDHQIFCSTVEKEVEYGLENTNLNESEIRQRVDQVLKLTGLEQYRTEHPMSLGKGDRQMIAVASILALKPEILVVDEPTTGLDWAGINKMMSLIKQLHQNGTTIVMISHDMEIVAQYAERVIVMKEGGILLDGSKKEVFLQSDSLTQTGIIPPQVSRLSVGLRSYGICAAFLYPEELIEAIEQAPEDLQCS